MPIIAIIGNVAQWCKRPIYGTASDEVDMSLQLVNFCHFNQALIEPDLSKNQLCLTELASLLKVEAYVHPSILVSRMFELATTCLLFLTTPVTLSVLSDLGQFQN